MSTQNVQHFFYGNCKTSVIICHLLKNLRSFIPTRKYSFIFLIEATLAFSFIFLSTINLHILLKIVPVKYSKNFHTAKLYGVLRIRTYGWMMEGASNVLV